MTQSPPTRPGNQQSSSTWHWFLYLFEGVELAIFMLSACVFSVLLFEKTSLNLADHFNAVTRRLVMGIAMGVTAILIILSPMGKRSGAHFNPAITLTYLRLGKIRRLDSAFYVLCQFLGGIFGVAVSVILLGTRLAEQPVDYAVTIPGEYGTTGAFFAELFMSALLMGVVLWTSNRPRFSKSTVYLVGCLIALYILLFAPVSGFSINPARTTGSAVFAHVWIAVWLYFAAPLLGMFGAAELYLRAYGSDRVLCAKLQSDAKGLCPFLCQYPAHRHRLTKSGANLPGSPI
jgi:aquaporin Z